MVKVELVAAIFVVVSLVYQIPVILLWPGWRTEPGAWATLYWVIGPGMLLFTWAGYAFCFLASRFLPKEKE
jgi:hypothetical protein